MQPITVLSLFDGTSCWRLALERAWIPVSSYYASEIDKYAIQVSKKNYPSIIHIGDVGKCEYRYMSGSKKHQWYYLLGEPNSDPLCTNMRRTDIDLLVGGSPCQWFSSAGKGLNFSDPRSKLFFEFVRILKETKPRYFLLENVKMKKEWQNIISEHLFGIQPVEIDSALVSAQRRKRLYRVGKRNEDWSYSQVVIKQPEDKGILLKDILEQEVDLKFYLTAKQWVGLQKYESNWRLSPTEGKCHTLSTMQWGLRQPKIYQLPRGNNPWGLKEGKSPTLSSNCWEHNNFLAVAQRGRYTEDGSVQQQFEVNPSGKANCLTSVQKDSLVLENRINIRRLTPIECERLQTLPDDYTAGVSNSQRYKMLGNGWTVDVIAHIFREMFKD